MYSLYTLLRHGTHQYDCHQFITVQDEVNYAVSEREDEVKDVTTLGKASMEKKTFSFGHCPNKGGGQHIIVYYYSILQHIIKYI